MFNVVIEREEDSKERVYKLDHYAVFFIFYFTVSKQEQCTYQTRQVADIPTCLPVDTNHLIWR